MKKILQKNQIIITALAIMIAVAGYLNYTGKDIEQYGLNTSDEDAEEVSGQNVTTEDGENGEATEEEEKKKKNKTKEMTDISAEDDGEDFAEVSDSGELVKSNETDGSDVASEENAGEAVMVSATLSADYFASAKISREQTRAKNKEILMSIVDDKNIEESQKEEALNRIIALTNAAEKESAAEMLLASKGFENCVVSIVDDSADVIVSANNLTQQQIAQIEDVVKRKTNIAAENIVITPVGINEEAKKE